MQSPVRLLSESIVRFGEAPPCSAGQTGRSRLACSSRVTACERSPAVSAAFAPFTSELKRFTHEVGFAALSVPRDAASAGEFTRNPMVNRAKEMNAR